jgi:hypothetical protein
MHNVQISASVNPVVISWLAEELEHEIPEVDINGSEKRLLDFACTDLEIYLETKMQDSNPEEVKKIAHAEDHKNEITAFLKVWTCQWIEKWRERVTLCQKMPQFSLSHVKAKKKATRIFKHMQHAKEMLEMGVQKLINNGEVCMAGLIAENLIIEEIAARLKVNEETPSENTSLDSWDIMQEVLPRVKQITERKTPLIHLKIMMDV